MFTRVNLVSGSNISDTHIATNYHLNCFGTMLTNNSICFSCRTRARISSRVGGSRKSYLFLFFTCITCLFLWIRISLAVFFGQFGIDICGLGGLSSVRIWRLLRYNAATPATRTDRPTYSRNKEVQKRNL